MAAHRRWETRGLGPEALLSFCVELLGAAITSHPERWTDRARADPSVRLVVVRGHGEAFAAGTDIADLVAVRTGADRVAYEGMITRVLKALRVPVVGLVFGRRLDDRAGGVEHDDVYARVYGSSDFHEGVAAFLAHRRPAWSGS